MFQSTKLKKVTIGKIIFPTIALLLFLALSTLTAAFAECPEGTYAVGTYCPEYLIKIPPGWSEGDGLVVFAHGYVDVTQDVAVVDYKIPTDIGEVGVSDIITGMGYAFATTSYSYNGLVIPQAVEDIKELARQFQSLSGAGNPGNVYLVGASEGGLVTALALENDPEDLFDGGLALCGPVGDFRRQINYFGDFLVLFNYFFPEVWAEFPWGVPTPQSVPDEYLSNWFAVVSVVLEEIEENPRATIELLKVSNAAFDSNDPSSIPETILWNLWYGIFATNDAIEKLGDSQPFDNSRRWYSGSRNDWRLNWRIDRYRADPEALEIIKENFQTTGNLDNPIVTMHTKKDPIVPYWHETIYNLKTLLGGSPLKHLNIPVSGYGHCEFTLEELVTAFTIMRLMAWFY